MLKRLRWYFIDKTYKFSNQWFRSPVTDRKEFRWKVNIFGLLLQRIVFNLIFHMLFTRMYKMWKKNLTVLVVVGWHCVSTVAGAAAAVVVSVVPTSLFIFSVIRRTLWHFANHWSWNKMIPQWNRFFLSLFLPFSLPLPPLSLSLSLRHSLLLVCTCLFLHKKDFS